MQDDILVFSQWAYSPKGVKHCLIVWII